MNRLDMESLNIVDKNIEKIAEIFPNVIVESENGISIDFDILKQELSNNIVESSKEKYQLTWPGKKEAILNANTPSKNTLRPLREKSVNFDSTRNVYIEGDNLEALKILQESYLNKIKCIYIDPPYNTGSNFIYNDNFDKPANHELLNSGQIDEEGNRLISNNLSNGRFHSDWLTMMYSRLKLARNLLKNEGIIFISIDDNELFNLKKICDEIFGENNFINCISIKMSELSGVKMTNITKFPKLKESLLIYCKDSRYGNLIIEKKKKDESKLDDYLKYYSSIITNVDKSPEEWKIVSINDYLKGKKLTEEEIKKFKLENSDRIVYRTSSRTIEKIAKNNPDLPSICEIINDEGKKVIKWDNKEMLFLNKYVYEYVGDIWMDISTINLNKENPLGTFENGQKPLKMLERILKSLDLNNEIVLDFFSGSASTAHAIMKLNSEINNNIRFIMVQLPEKIDSEEFDNICELGEERIRRAADKIKEEIDADIDYGFRVYKIDSSNMKDIYYKPEQLQQSQLNLFETNIKEDRTSDDLLTQVILDLGLTLDLKIEEKNILNNKVYYVDDNSLVACFDDEIDSNIVDEISKSEPLKVVFKDDSFTYDNDKINLQERFKKLSPDTEISII